MDILDILLLRKNLPSPIIKVLNTLKRYKTLQLLLSCLQANEIMRLLVTSQTLHDFFCTHLANALPIPWYFYHQYYQHELQAAASSPPSFKTLKYNGVRDSLLLLYLQPLLRDTSNPQFKNITDLLATLKLTRILQDTEYKTPKIKHNHILWNNILTSISEQNRKILENSISAIKEKLIQQEIKNIEQTLIQLDYFVREKSTIVVTFNADIFTKKATYLLNFFQTYRNNKISKTSQENSYYLAERIAAEFLHYAHAKLPDLHQFLINPHTHPCYGTLQFRIEPIIEYGNSFMVMSSVVKNSSTAIFGAPFTRMLYKNIRLLPVRVTDSGLPLIAQFPQDLLQACLQNPFPKDFNMQFASTDSKYIEVQLPANIPIQKPDYIEHIHFGLGKKLPTFRHIDTLLNKGISISIGSNPFHSMEFNEAYKNKQHIKLINDTVSTYLYQTILFIGETIGETHSTHLIFTHDAKTMQFSFAITPNSPPLHQAQAAALLYLLGVHDFFKTVSALSLTDEIKQLPLLYNLPLDNTLCKQGDLKDHDAYSNNYLSLRKLLAVLLKRIFSIILVSKQNETHLLLHNTPHPFTGKGATEEINQTRELYLGDEKHQYAINIHWLYDSITLEVISTQPSHHDHAFKIFADLLEQHVFKQDNLIIIGLSVPELLKTLAQHKSNYQACVIYEDKILKHYGDLLLAWREGFVTPGGHNNDPYSWIGAFTEIEFGKLKANWQSIHDSQKFIGTSPQPSTRYYSLPSSCLATVKEDIHEFVENSLQHFAIYELGKLNSTQIAQAAKLLNTTLLEYQKFFGNSLALRPLPSIIIYLTWCEKTLAQLLVDLFHKLPKLTVKIQAEVETITFNSKSYWRPAANFGEIEICCDSYYLKPLKKYCDELTHLASNTLTESSLLLTGANPQQVIQAIEQAPALELKKNDPLIIEKLFTEVKQHRLTYLNQFHPLKICEILTLAIANGIKLSQTLGEQGGQIIVRLIDEWLKHVGQQTQDHSKEIKEEKKFNQDNLTQYQNLKNLIDQFSDTQWDADKKTTLHIATEAKSLGAVKYLCDNKGINTLVRDRNKATSLHYICATGNIDLATYFVNTNINTLFLRNAKKQSPWYIAAINNHWPLIAYFSEVIADQSLPKKSKNRLKAYLEAEANSDQYQRSILHLLCYCTVAKDQNFITIFCRLMQLFQPAINLKDKSHNDMLHFAVKHKFRSLIDPLIAAKANLDSQNALGQTISHLAIIDNDAELAFALYSEKASVSIQDRDGNTPLHLALIKKNFILFALLKNCDYNNSYPTLKNKDNLTAAAMDKELDRKTTISYPDPVVIINAVIKPQLVMLKNFAYKQQRTTQNISISFVYMLYKNFMENHEYAAYHNVASLILLGLLSGRPRLTKRQLHNQLIRNGFFKAHQDKSLRARSYCIASTPEITNIQYRSALIDLTI